MMTLPPIRDWWSELSLEARVEVLGEAAPHLSERAREEIRTITGAVVGMAETLSDEDLDYARSEARSEIDEDSD
jgi:vacuolar-type H+-ATPase subunit H